MILAPLYSLVIMLTSISSDLAIVNATINKQAPFRELYFPTGNNHITIHSQVQHENRREQNEIKSNLDNDIKQTRRKRHLNNQYHRNLTQKKETLLTMEKDHVRMKRHSNKRNCLGVCTKSLCQWKEIWDFDNSRNPVFIPKAECSSKCNFEWTSVVIPNVINIYTACEPIKRDIPIYKNNEYRYIKDWPVACACTIKPILGLPSKQSKNRNITNYKKLKKTGQRKRMKVNSKDKISKSKYVEIRTRLMRPIIFLPEFKK